MKSFKEDKVKKSKSKSKKEILKAIKKKKKSNDAPIMK